MTQNIEINFARNTLKATGPSTDVLAGTINGLMREELDRKVRDKQPTHASHHWQLLQKSWVELSSVYLQSLMERMPRIYEAVITKRGSF